MEKKKEILRGLSLADDIIAYCNRYGIPINHFLEIISDQKVVPMIRGKGTEYAVLDLLRKHLSPKAWRVEKSNLNPQPGILDEDIVVINLETSIRIVVESKNAVRGSFSLGTKATPKPHFKVKCHKSRSFMGKDTNDRYLDVEFDLLFTNPSNSLIMAGESFQLIPSPESIKFLMDLYKVDNPESLFEKSNEDWRFAISKEIAVDGVIPRNPGVLMENDQKWMTIKELDIAFEKTLKLKVKKLVEKVGNS